MELELPDGNILALPDDATGADAAAAIGPGLARAALAVKVDGDYIGEAHEAVFRVRPNGIAVVS